MKRSWIFLLLISAFVFLANSQDAEDFEKKYNLRIQVDKKADIAWYKHKNNWDTNSRLYVYFGYRNRDKALFFKMVIAYYGQEKIFPKEYKFTVDGEESVIIPRNTIRTIDTKDNQLGNMDEKSKGVCEIYDIAVNQEEFDLVQKIGSAKEVRLRYDGVKGYEFVSIHEESKTAIREVISGFREFIQKQKK